MTVRLMQTRHIVTKIMTALAAAVLMSSCDTEGGEEAQGFTDVDFSYTDRVLAGNSLEIRVGKNLISPEIYVGEQKMDITVRQGNDGNMPETIISVHFPDEISTEMNPGMDGPYCCLVLKSGVEGTEGIFEDEIARVRFYEKTMDFKENITTGEPETAGISGAYCIYLDSSREEDMEWRSHDSRYKVPVKVAGENPERLIFMDSEGNRLEDVNMQQVMSVSEDYVYAELEYPMSVDTIYIESEISPGTAFQDLEYQYKEVLIRVSDGRLLSMPSAYSSEEPEHYGHICQWMSDDMFYFSEAVPYNGEMPEIRGYRVNGDSVTEAGKSYSASEYPEDVKTFSWTANEKDGIIINELDYFSFEENRLDQDGIYYETTDTWGEKYLDRMKAAYYILPPFVAADGNFYSVIGDRRYVTGTYYVTPRLYRMEEEAVFKPVTDLCRETGNLVEHRAFQARYAGTTYVFIDGCYCSIDSSGNVTKTEDPDFSITEMALTPRQYWPYSTDRYCFLPDGASGYHMLSLDDPSSAPEPVEGIGPEYTNVGYMDDIGIFIRPGTTYSDCLITVGNTLKYSLKLEGLDIINSGTYDWTVTGQAE